MSVIGEAALSAFFGKLFDNLTSYDLLKFFQEEKVDADLKRWRTTLMKIHAVLDDAEEKQMTNRFVKIWLDELEDLAYDVDDILDEFATEALRRKLNPEPSTSKVRKIVDACIGSNRSFATTMRSKIEEIDTRLQNIVTDKKDLELREYTGGTTRTTRLRVPTTSLVNEGRVYGREEDKKAIVKLLLSGESSDAQLSVIPILGMGGLGKTTLAQLVYNDDEVSHYFDLKAWVCVSEEFDIIRVTKAILQSVTFEHCDANDLDSIQVKLKETLSGKKFLLILDDVWNENYDDWTKLRSPFEFGALGSKIIVTTRNYGVSSTMGTTPTSELKELSSDASWNLFSQHALGTTDYTAHPKLEEIGRKILDKCKGSPLAAKVLGGLLRTKHDHDEWKDVLDSKIWDIPEEKSSIFPILKLSYQYLPSHLKGCFAYCSLFPKDYEFEKKELVLLWMAEGFFQETEINGCEQLDVSIPNFPKLHALEIKGCKGVVSRSTDELCFPKSTILSIPYVKSLTEEFMHGLAKVENLKIDNCKELTSLWQDEFISLISLDIRDCSSLVNISLTSTLRTLNIEGCSGLKSLSISNCTCLEKASIWSCNSLTLISRGQLPQNLKTLDIRDCENLQFLVDEGEASSNSSSLLEDLSIKHCPSLKCLSSSGDLPTTLKRLQISSCVEFTSLSSKNELPTALKYLSVRSCPKMESIANNLPNNASLEFVHIGSCAKLKSLPVGLHKLCHLNYIGISRCPSFVSFPDGGLLPTSLRKLSIQYCEKLEAWPNCMPNLNSLHIVNCPSVVYFPKEGYPTCLTSLSFGGENICKQVTVWGLHRLTSLTSLCIDGGFPDWQSFPNEQDGKLTMMLPSSLTHLTIWSIPNIVILSSKCFQNLSALEQLVIRNCPKLASLPEKGLPPSLLRLDIDRCPLLKQHCKKGGREWSKIANVPCVKIDGRDIYS